jgi:hypothetical protein
MFSSGTFANNSVNVLFAIRIVAMNNNTIDTINFYQNEAGALSWEFSDEALEAAADGSAMSYTYQTSAYNRCCH